VAKSGPKPRPVEERFWEKVDRTGTCWLWTGSCKWNGYGQFKLTSATAPVLAHCFAYQLLVGPIPEGLTLDHMCHNADVTCQGGLGCIHRRCVNPSHLEPVTNRENHQRAATRTTNCANGHARTLETTYRRPKGTRECRICQREAKRKRKG